MTKTVVVAAAYAVSSETLWRHVVRYDALERMMSGRFIRVACPKGEQCAGQNVTLWFALFGVVPVSRWRLAIVERNDATRRLVSEEGGSFVRRWRHQIEIDALGSTESRLTDTIEIDAGRFTARIARFAEAEYARRHRLRQALLSNFGDSAPIERRAG